VRKPIPQGWLQLGMIDQRNVTHRLSRVAILVGA
jgi:hypothetical protein